MLRTAEPQELMDNREQAEAYASADFSEPNNLFLQLLHQLLPQGPQGLLLDLGCGPAHIAVALLSQHPHLRIRAVDGAAAMLDLARKTAADALVADRLDLLHESLPSDALFVDKYQGVLSNSLLHHVANPNHLWQAIKHCSADQAAVLVMDLARPASRSQVDALVERHAATEAEVLREDYRNSLHAAYTVDEVQAQLAANDLTPLSVAMVSDRHWAVCGNLPRR